MRILFVAADSMEFTGILHHTAEVRPQKTAVDWARSGRLNGNDVLLVANGIGRNRAAAAVDRALEHFRADAVVSTGFCGALDENLGIAGLVAATEISTTDGSFPAAAPIRTENCRRGPIASVDHVVGTTEEKRRLRASGAVAVEMEAAGVAARAQTCGLPFYCVRAISDLAGETLANDFNGALRADGHFDTMFILGQALRHPSARVPELLRLRGRCVQAARTLGEFFADCGF